MLLKLNRAAPSNINPVELNFNRVLPVTNVQVYGFGTIQPGSNAIPDELQMVEVDVIQDKRCMNQYATIRAKVNPDVMICAARMQKDSCQGDSGGPLVFTNENGIEFQVGIVRCVSRVSPYKNVLHV